VINFTSPPRRLDTGADFLTVATDSVGRIVSVREKISAQSAKKEELVRSAGLVDLQVNGLNGVDFNDESITADDVDHALSGLLSTGVTTCLPTLITASAETLQKRLHALDAAVSRSTLGPLMVPGYHLEGPFLNPAKGYAGCHPPADMILPSIDLIKNLERGLARPILYVTIAPELEGALEFIEWAVETHKIVGLGHSALRRQDLSAAVKAGALISTHLGNGVAQIQPKFDNPILWQLSEDKIFGAFIADGIHIPREILKLFIRAKSIERSILVTDAIAAANSAPGTYFLAGMAVELNTRGIVHVAGSSLLAGSSLTMDRALANIVSWGIADFRSALRMGCANPMALLWPVCEAHGVTQGLGEIIWGRNHRPLSVSLGAYECCLKNSVHAPEHE